MPQTYLPPSQPTFGLLPPPAYPVDAPELRNELSSDSSASVVDGIMLGAKVPDATAYDAGPLGGTLRCGDVTEMVRPSQSACGRMAPRSAWFSTAHPLRRRRLQRPRSPFEVRLSTESYWSGAPETGIIRVMDDAVREYVDAIAPEYRPIFDRLHRLVVEERPDAVLVISYKMPMYRLGRRRLFVGVWKHGLSIYGWDLSANAGFAARHPEFITSKGTIRLTPAAAADLADSELRELICAALADSLR